MTYFICSSCKESHEIRDDEQLTDLHCFVCNSRCLEIYNNENVKVLTVEVNREA